VQPINLQTMSDIRVDCCASSSIVPSLIVDRDYVMLKLKQVVRAAAPLAAAILVGPAVAGDKVPADLSLFPEMSPEQTLPKIAAALRDSLTDAGSVTNFYACYPPVRIKWENGKPVRWTILLSLNAKNSYGGYAGAQGMAAVFYANKPVETFSIGMPLGAKQLAGCMRVPNAEIQRLLQAD
jgi:hypothetical protein